MPLVIRELVIRATVDDGAEPAEQLEPASPPAQEDVVAECIDQVFEILRQREER